MIHMRANSAIAFIILTTPIFCGCTARQESVTGDAAITVGITITPTAPQLGIPLAAGGLALKYHAAHREDEADAAKAQAETNRQLMETLGLLPRMMAGN